MSFLEEGLLWELDQRGGVADNDSKFTDNKIRSPLAILSYLHHP